MQYRLTDQSIDEFTAEFDLLRRKAESKMKMGAGSPEQLAPILRMHYAGLSRREKSPGTGPSQNSLKFIEVAAYKRRLFRLPFGASRQDVLIAQEADRPSMREKTKKRARRAINQETGRWSATDGWSLQG